MEEKYLISGFWGASQLENASPVPVMQGRNGGKNEVLFRYMMSDLLQHFGNTLGQAVCNLWFGTPRIRSLVESNFRESMTVPGLIIVVTMLMVFIGTGTGMFQNQRIMVVVVRHHSVNQNHQEAVQ